MISVIIPVFNNYKTLGRCLASVVSQTYNDIEIIVVDDGSYNASEINKIISRHSDVKLLRQENKGAPSARNRGYRESKGDFLIFLDADIVLKRNALQKMLKTLLKSEAAYCYSAYKLGWKKFSLLEFDVERLRKFNYIHTSSLIRRKVFSGFDENLKRFQDWDLWLTLAENGYYGIGIDEVLFKIIDMNGTISVWLPKFFYKIRWPIFGFTPKQVKKYKEAEKIIRIKHNL